MALTPEQQASLDMTIAIEADRHANQMALESRRTKLEAVRLAKETLIENRRNQPVDARDVAATDITAYANTLVNYINS